MPKGKKRDYMPGDPEWRPRAQKLRQMREAYQRNGGDGPAAVQEAYPWLPYSRAEAAWTLLSSGSTGAHNPLKTKDLHTKVNTSCQEGQEGDSPASREGQGISQPVATEGFTDVSLHVPGEHQGLSGSMHVMLKEAEALTRDRMLKPKERLDALKVYRQLLSEVERLGAGEVEHGEELLAFIRELKRERSEAVENQPTQMPGNGPELPHTGISGSPEYDDTGEGEKIDSAATQRVNEGEVQENNSGEQQVVKQDMLSGVAPGRQDVNSPLF